jgi:antitoxin HicB
MLAYSALFEAEGEGYVITFPDIPEAITEGDSHAEAAKYAIDALEMILSEYINRRREIPQPKRMRGKNIRLVQLSALAEAKINLYRTMRAANVRKAEPARLLGWQKSQVDRLLDLTHASHLDQLEAAFSAFHKRLTIHVEDAA